MSLTWRSLCWHSNQQQSNQSRREPSLPFEIQKVTSCFWLVGNFPILNQSIFFGYIELLSIWTWQQLSFHAGHWVSTQTKNRNGGILFKKWHFWSWNITEISSSGPFYWCDFKKEEKLVSPMVNLNTVCPLKASTASNLCLSTLSPTFAYKSLALAL